MEPSDRCALTPPAITGCRADATVPAAGLPAIPKVRDATRPAGRRPTVPGPPARVVTLAAPDGESNPKGWVTLFQSRQELNLLPTD